MAALVMNGFNMVHKSPVKNFKTNMSAYQGINYFQGVDIFSLAMGYVCNEQKISCT